MTYCLEQNDVLKSLSVTITETIVADMMHKTSPTMNCTAMPDDVFGLLGAPRDHTAAVFLCRGSRWLVIEEGTDQSHQHFCCAVSACKGQLHQSSTSSTLRHDSSYCAIWLAWGASAWLVWFCYTCQTYKLYFPQKQVCNLPTSHSGQDTNVLHMGIQIGFQVLYSHFC